MPLCRRFGTRLGCCKEPTDLLKSPIWDNNYYQEIARLSYGLKWKPFGISHIFRDGKLRPFSELGENFRLHASMHFYYLQIQHVVNAQNGVDQWSLDSTSVFNYPFEVTTYKRFISCCYAIILKLFLRDAPLKAVCRWEQDVAVFEEQWEEALQAVPHCSLNMSQRLSQLYIMLRVH